MTEFSIYQINVDRDTANDVWSTERHYGQKHLEAALDDASIAG